LKDQEIVSLAQREGRIILTHDLDFGEIYHLTSGGEVGVIVLRLRRQTVEAVNEVLTRFLASGILDDEKLHRALIVVSELWYRVYRGSRQEF
jgi:predicted nuclease of predicted toxin-antitoxin system